MSILFYFKLFYLLFALTEHRRIGKILIFAKCPQLAERSFRNPLKCYIYTLRSLLEMSVCPFFHLHNVHGKYSLRRGLKFDMGSSRDKLVNGHSYISFWRFFLLLINYNNYAIKISNYFSKKSNNALMSVYRNFFFFFFLFSCSLLKLSINLERKFNKSFALRSTEMPQVSYYLDNVFCSVFVFHFLL